MVSTSDPKETKPDKGQNVEISPEQVLINAQNVKDQAEFPLRGKLASQPLNSVVTNHFAMGFNPKLPMYHYEIKGFPTPCSKSTRKTLIQNLFRQLPFTRDPSNRKRFVTDFEHTIVSWIKFPLEALKKVQVSSRPGATGISMHIEVANGGQALDTAALVSYVQGRSGPNKNLNDRITELTRLLNLAVSKPMENNEGDGTPPKANKFFVDDNPKPTRLCDSLCAKRGFFYSVRPGQGKILLNMNVCTSAFWYNVLVSKVLRDAAFETLPDRKAALRGLRVRLVEYKPRNIKSDTTEAQELAIRTKIITGFGDFCDNQTFMVGEDKDEPTTVSAYFKKTYNVTDIDGQVAVNCGSRDRPEWYPSNKLMIVPNQMYKRKIPDAFTSAMLDAACTTAADTKNHIETGLGRLGIRPQPNQTGLRAMPAWPPIEIDPKMAIVAAKFQLAPAVLYHQGRVVFRKAKWNLSGRSFLQRNPSRAVKVSFLFVGVSDQQQQDAISRDFVHHARQTYQIASFSEAHRLYLNFGDLVDRDVVETKMKDIMARKKVDFFVLVLQSKNVPAYSTFKDVCDRSLGVQCSCIVRKNGMGAPYYANVMMKVNLKIGGINHTTEHIRDTLTRSPRWKDTMILGADVTHSGPGSIPGTPSIAAIVGSVDPLYGKFLGSMRLQERLEACEDIQDVDGMVQERIEAWKKHNSGRLPKNIIYYRDGVSESQYAQVKNGELPQIRTAFMKVANKDPKLKNSKPAFKLTAIVVAKRHHVRFFDRNVAAKAEELPKSGNSNCEPGLMVDNVVTSPYFNDFFLQSHDGIKGTAKPAHYFVLENEMQLAESDLHKFTYELCHTYVRATTGVSYAPPAYYADRLCERGRCYLRGFLVPNAATRDGFDNQKRAIERQAQDKRNRLFASKRTKDGDRIVRSEEEKERIVKDAEGIDKTMREIAYGKAREAFYKYAQAGSQNPWRPQIADTMFWM